MGVTVTSAVNRIASARLVYADGKPSEGDFPLASASTFVPGAEIEILAGTVNEPVSLFKGFVVRQSIRAKQKGASELTVECRHGAFKMTIGRKNAVFLETTDSDVVSTLIGGASLTADVATTSVTHAQLVQYRSTDWDFLVSRAQANGQIVVTTEDKVIVKAASTGGSSVATLAFGATILEIDAQIDARTQFSAVKGFSWDPATQEGIEVDAADPSVAGPGNLTTDDLSGVAGLSSFDLRHPSLPEAELQAWADAEWKRTQSNRVCGRVKCEGIATVKVGDIVTLEGVGDRYSGDVFVTAVRHDNTPGEGWKTNLQFGGIEPFGVSEQTVSAPKAAGLLPSVSGLQIGIVVSNEDSSGEFCVGVTLPLVAAGGESLLARVASLDAGKERGFFFRPEVGDEVVVGFLDDDPRRPVILGMLHSSANAAPLTGTDDNFEKVYQSKSKIRIYINDDTKVLMLETPGGNKVTLSDEDKGIKLEDQNGNVIAMDADGVRIESSKALTLKSSTEATIESGTSLSAKGGSELKLEGANSAELSSSGETAIKGSKVKLGS